jgi:hypothetical protein
MSSTPRRLTREASNQSEGIAMPHTYSLQNVPSYVAAGEVHYRNLLAEAAEARRFVPERTRHAAGARTVGAALRNATSTVLIRLGMWLQGAAVPGITDTAPSPLTGTRLAMRPIMTTSD